MDQNGDEDEQAQPYIPYVDVPQVYVRQEYKEIYICKRQGYMGIVI